MVRLGVCREDLSRGGKLQRSVHLPARRKAHSWRHLVLGLNLIMGLLFKLKAHVLDLPSHLGHGVDNEDTFFTVGAIFVPGIVAWA